MLEKIKIKLKLIEKKEAKKKAKKPNKIWMSITLKRSQILQIWRQKSQSGNPNSNTNLLRNNRGDYYNFILNIDKLHKYKVR